MPGFTPISMFPACWLASGLSYPELIDELIELALPASRRSSRSSFPELVEGPLRQAQGTDVYASPGSALRMTRRVQAPTKMRSPSCTSRRCPGWMASVGSSSPAAPTKVPFDDCRSSTHQRCPSVLSWQCRLRDAAVDAAVDLRVDVAGDRGAPHQEARLLQHDDLGQAARGQRVVGLLRRVPLGVDPDLGHPHGRRPRGRRSRATEATGPVGCSRARERGSSGLDRGLTLDGRCLDVAGISARLVPADVALLDVETRHRERRRERRRVRSAREPGP